MTTNPLDAAGEVEDQGRLTRELERIEAQLAREMNMSRQSLRRRLPEMLRREEVIETALVSEWLMLYAAAMDYATHRTAGPPPVARDEEGPQNAALAAFGVAHPCAPCVSTRGLISRRRFRPTTHRLRARVH